MHCHNEFTDDNHVVEVDLPLQFRSVDRSTQDLTAGLRLDAIFSDWEQTPFRGCLDELPMSS